MDLETSISCVHHWILSNATEVLTGDLALENEGCIGRSARCKLCHESKLLIERIDFTFDTDLISKR